MPGDRNGNKVPGGRRAISLYTERVAAWRGIKDIRSVPVGYLSILEMYPLDFREFCEANRVSQTVMDKLKECFEKKQPVDELIHEK